MLVYWYQAKDIPDRPRRGPGKGGSKMKGTEKQIAWASDIKEAWKLSLEDAHRFSEKVGAKAPMPEEIREYIDELMNETESHPTRVRGLNR